MHRQSLLEGLQAAGIKLTAQRKAICDWLQGSETHPSAAVVFESLKNTTPGLSLATVYNTLSLLVELDLIHEVTHSPDGSVRYDPNTTPHLNLVCYSCGAIFDQPIPTEHINVLNHLVQAQQFAMRDAIIVLHGLCKYCQHKGQTS
jgi:Fur family transcriptional regulator, peroxide stress response regulator